ncbi:hypothetical protein M011DRAFT_410818 [Sporormia fimetaria CBS 119925]|uniref:Zinc finger PHD-type domain-containing protein n=1 Tax=Sporormia fimetaria CBS 119925 TaxID=1340428 RepID=A0A6A6V1Y0_9PLEO|nr:hypothetical protein M011DRAFT_410818 [Sporormia fimetaria CBS 119925]
MSPRRSSRARIPQLPSTLPATPTLSDSSSARTERAMPRTNHKQSSPQKAGSPRSLSSEEPQMEPPLTRRRTREHIDEPDPPHMNDNIDDEEDEQEVTRCVCTFLEYPGPPSVGHRTKDSVLADADAHNEESGLFIQCDTCHVWQHGQCVGIMDEASSPDEYFCEECRKDLHKLMIDSRGQKYSRYLPVYELLHGRNTRKSSLTKEAEVKAARDKDRNQRARADSFGKRRSTMNSRAAYDEDEVLRKVLEESKHEGGTLPSENGSRKKRSRDDSEESKPEVKRQRTSSRSPSDSPVIETEDENQKAPAMKQKPRGAAARSQREKELREKERERAEAANRRKGRAERRKIEGARTEPEPTEANPVEETTPMPPPAPEATPDETPTADLKPAPAPRKSGRPPQKRGRLGRNQHSKDNLGTTNGASPLTNGDTPRSPHVANGVNGQDSSDGNGKPAKSKHWRLEKLSWNEIRRPAGAMQNYITARQVEMAGEKRSTLAVQALVAHSASKAEEAKAAGDILDDFKKMSTLQMMDDLSRDLVLWQRMVAEVTEK